MEASRDGNVSVARHGFCVHSPLSPLPTQPHCRPGFSSLPPAPLHCIRRKSRLPDKKPGAQHLRSAGPAAARARMLAHESEAEFDRVSGAQYHRLMIAAAASRKAWTEAELQALSHDLFNYEVVDGELHPTNGPVLPWRTGLGDRSPGPVQHEGGIGCPTERFLPQRRATGLGRPSRRAVRRSTPLADGAPPHRVGSRSRWGTGAAGVSASGGQVVRSRGLGLSGEVV